MQPVELVYAKNIARHRSGMLRQELSLCLSVAILGGEKHVAVAWAGEDGRWHEAAAAYLCPSGQARELWQARLTFEKKEAGSLPGMIRFAVRCAAAGREYWDNNDSRDYTAEAGCGIMLRPGLQLAAVDPCRRLGRWQEIFPVSAAVRMEARPQQVFVRWTTDGWATCRTTACSFKGRHGKKGGAGSGAAGGPGIWTAQLPVHDAFRLEYALASQTPAGTIWDNNLGRNYRASRQPLKVLTLNLHCYQEDHQEEKFRRIAAAVNDLDIDLVCLQEVGEHWRGGHGDWNSNAAKIIGGLLVKPYHLVADWSHIGFERYREGSAILSRYPFLISDAGYVSASEDVRSIHARKVCMARLQAPGMGLVNLFCAHLSWWSQGFQEQFETLSAWAERWHDASAAATLLCGDFNVPYGSSGYCLAAELYDDQVRQPDSGRIDYIFMRKGSRLKAVASRRLFTDADYGRVSDHSGYLVEFEPG